MLVELLTPLSDVMNNAIAYELVAVLNDEVDEGPLCLSVKLRRTTPAGGPVLEQQIVVAAPDADRTGRRQLVLSISAESLAPGEYSGELRIAGDRTHCGFNFYRMPEAKPPAMPFGIYAFPMPQTVEAADALLREWRATGIDLITGHMHALSEEAAAFYDRAARFGMTFRPSMRFWRADSGTDWAKPFKGRTNGREPRGKGVCLNRGDLRELAAANVADALRSYRRHAAFSGTTYFGDDLFLPSHFAEGQAAIGCYCERCVADYQAVTGEAPPETTTVQRGHVRADHPWLHWNRFRCDRQYADFLRAIMAAKDSVDPSIVIGPVHGPPDNPFAQVATGLYGPRTQVMDAVSSYAYPFLRSPAVDFIFHFELGRMNHRDKPVWMLGFLEGDRTMAPPWHVTQSYWNMLAAGYRTVAFFSWWGLPALRNGDSAEVRARVEESVAALARCGRHRQWIFPAAAYWRRPETRYALLYSLTTESFDVAPVWRHHTHAKRLGRVYRQALARQLELDVVSEEEVLGGLLDNYDTVFLHDVRAIRDDAGARISEFAGREGKRVFLDQDLLYNDGWHPMARVSIEGAVEVTAESMVNLLDLEAGPRIRCDNSDVALRRFTAGDAEYLVLVNNVPDRVAGMPYSYGDPQRNYDHAGLVPNTAIETVLTVPDGGRWLFDAATGEPLGNSDTPLRLHLEPAWGRVVTVLRSPEARLAADVTKAAVAGSSLVCRLSMTDDAGNPLRAAFSVHVGIERPDGTVAEGGSRFEAIENGVLDVEIPLGANVQTGTWRLTFTGGFPRRAVSREVQVSEPLASPSFLTAAAHHGQGRRGTA